MTTTEQPLNLQSPRGLDWDSVPMRLWEKAKQLMWDPADIDYSQERADWESLNDAERAFLLRLCGAFMTGEEQVTVDILPLIRVMSDEGRLEETMYLTTFAFEEAKHVDFFRRWFDAVGVDTTPLNSNVNLTEIEVPKVMRRLDTDRSPKAVLDAGITYNQFVEAVTALSGYRIFDACFANRDVLRGLRRGIELIQRDERRHIAYGTYMCRRVLAANPELWEFTRQRMDELVVTWMGLNSDGGVFAGVVEPYPFGVGPGVLGDWPGHQIGRRLEAMRVGVGMTVADVESGEIEENPDAA